MKNMNVNAEVFKKTKKELVKKIFFEIIILIVLSSLTYLCYNINQQKQVNFENFIKNHKQESMILNLTKINDEIYIDITDLKLENPIIKIENGKDLIYNIETIEIKNKIYGNFSTVSKYLEKQDKTFLKANDTKILLFNYNKEKLLDMLKKEKAIFNHEFLYAFFIIALILFPLTIIFYILLILKNIFNLTFFYALRLNFKI